MKRTAFDYSDLAELGKLYTLAVPLVIFTIILLAVGVAIPFNDATGKVFITAGLISGGFDAVYILLLWLMQGESIETFAQKNGFKPLSDDKLAELLPPCLLMVGENPSQSNGYEIAYNNHEYWLYDYSVWVPGYKFKQRYTFSVMAFSLKKTYPHIYLDGHQNGNFLAYSSDQQIELEGDFNEAFSLYVPNGEQIDALSIITPDVMQTLMKGGRPYDIEIVGNKVLIISFGSSYGEHRLPPLLQFADNLRDELAHRDVSWHPIPLGVKKKALSRGMSTMQAVKYAAAASATMLGLLYITSRFTQP